MLKRTDGMVVCWDVEDPAGPTCDGGEANSLKQMTSGYFQGVYSSRWSQEEENPTCVLGCGGDAAED